jgi:hypothetical protein
MSPPPAGYPARTTSRRVKVADAVAGVVVRSGGVLVILAVAGILLFLVGTVLPLFQGATVRETTASGRVPTAEVLERIPIPGLERTRVACARLSVRSHDLVVGSVDGRVAMLGLAFDADYVIGAEADATRKRVPEGRTVTDGASLLQRRPGGTLQRIHARVEPRGVAELPRGAGPVVAAGYATHEGAGMVAAVGADGRAPRPSSSAPRPSPRAAPRRRRGCSRPSSTRRCRPPGS